MTQPILVSVTDAAKTLAISTAQVYALAAEGRLEKRYIGKGTRNFRLTYKSLERYAASLSQDPVAS
jgi:hypothetical protein